MTSFVIRMLNDLKGHCDTAEQEDYINDLDNANNMVLDSLQKTARNINDFKSVANYQYDTDLRKVDLAPKSRMSSNHSSQL